MTTLQLVTLVIAIAGLAVAMFSLGWQVVSWLASGWRIKVETSTAYLTYDAPVDVRPAVLVVARNVGRTAVDVTGWAFALPDDQQIVFIERPPWVGPEGTVRLEPGQSAQWQVDGYVLRRELRDRSYPPDSNLRGRVNLATGKVVVSKKSVSIGAFVDDLGPPPEDRVIQY